MTEKIRNLIKKYEVKGDFTHAEVSDAVIAAAEQTLNVKLPQQYIAFLKEFGHGGIGGIDTLGVGLTGRMIFLETTLEYRRYGLPQSFVVIENCDEWLYCIDCSSYKVVSWEDGYAEDEYGSFDDYLAERINEAAENI
ncbi:SMI1/KNR4 family protein [bacterium]|nr:SMI1/KNR4 family protein [bacterium]